MNEFALLSLDAGNTIVFLDHASCAEIIAATMGRVVSVQSLEHAEGVAKRRLDQNRLLAPLPDPDITPSWGAFMSTLVQEALNGEEAEAVACTRALWQEHRRFNLWRKVPDDLVAAVGALRKRGVPVVVVSNSEGQLTQLFEQLGLDGVFDLVLDSHEVGVEKPDSRIFELALRPFGVEPARALHLGDTYGTDVVGAQRAGLQVALIDPFGHYDGQHPEVPRVKSVASVCRAPMQQGHSW